MIPRSELIEELWEAHESMYQEAWRARQKAMSWRRFDVGVAVLARKAGSRRKKIFSGANTKHPNALKICGEPIAITGAFVREYTEAIGIMIVGMPQFDEDSGKHTHTLHPCHNCRVFLYHHPMVQAHTPIITALPPGVDPVGNKPRWEVHPFAEILRIHGEPC